MDTDSLYAPYIDEEYAAFSSRLTKNHDLPYRGVRVPVLRKLAKELETFPYTITCHEDVLLKGFWITSRKIPFREKREIIAEHLSLLQTWDEVDTLASSIKPRKAELAETYDCFFSLLSEERTMPRRLGIVTLMSLRKLYPEKREELLEAITAADNDEYYISMAVAWALTSFIMDDRDNEAWLEKLSDATRQKTKQKIRDSERERKKK